MSAEEIAKNYIEDTDEELIRRLRAGESEILEYLMEKYKPLVRGKANAMYLIGGENEDLIQEGMIGLFKAVRDFKQEKDHRFAGFATLCVNRQIYSAIVASNRKKNQPLNNYVSMSPDASEEGIALENVLSDEAMNPERLVIEYEYRKGFWEKLNQELSKMERAVLQMYLNGMNYVMIAEQMKKPPKSIDNALQRIRKKIRLLNEKVGE